MTNDRYELPVMSGEVATTFLQSLAQTIARFEEPTPRELLLSLQVDLESMQLRADVSRTRLEGLHRALEIRVEQYQRKLRS